MKHDTRISTRALLARHGADTRLAAIPLESLPPPLQQTCEAFIDTWWERLDMDQPLQASGLGNMTLAELLAYHGQRTNGAHGEPTLWCSQHNPPITPITEE
jgi:hypothetical protein